MKGLSTREALLRLKSDIQSVLEECRPKEKTRLDYILKLLHHSNEDVFISGIGYSVTIVYVFLLILLYFIHSSPQVGINVIIEALLLTLLLFVNIYLAIHEDKYKNNEMERKVQHVIGLLEKNAEACSWSEENYPNLCAPVSPCVTLQWTYRDGKLVNLPWVLLVNGDVIVVKPGQEVPGHCKTVDSTGEFMISGQIYQPAIQEKETFTTPRIRTPYKNKECIVMETPYLANLRQILTKSLHRPISVHNKLRYLCTVKLLEGIIMPFAISITLISTLCWHFNGILSDHWSEMYLLQIMSVTLPLLQLVFPIFWIILNCYGLARFKKLSEIRQKFLRPKSCSISEEINDPLVEALSETNLSAEHIKKCWQIMYNIYTGKEDMVTRTANIVHVLGSLSTLCCVDKKGILSWPNPTAEKVFLLRNSEPMSKSSSKTSMADSASQSEETNIDDGRKQQLGTGTIAEVLDLTHDQNSAFCVEFDDSSWRFHLTRLKPVGLAALLNTCRKHTADHYAQLCAHLTCEALLTEDLVPVTNRRCLCELAKQLGFKEEATEPYTQVDNVAIFRHLQEDTIKRETRFARSLQLAARVKVPLPHMLAVIVRDPGRQLHMVTQGTADIILDSCVDYWNGEDLTALTPSDRKKALDFYQRNSLTAYCTAFAYKPLGRGVSRTLASQYLELPPECNHMQPVNSAIWNEQGDTHFHSTDSLLYSESKEVDVDDVAGYYELQSEQILLGMVTMQYQAQSDMVELIERLERACIRFVHFSKENELRSRVFNEKLGLESGWNCHISLMSETCAASTTGCSPELVAQDEEDEDSFSRPESKLLLGPERATTPHAYFYSSNDLSRYKTLSSSAPGAIHLDHATVKFFNEKPRHSVTTQDMTKVNVVSESIESGLEESGAEGCRSISCLTDSTDRSAPVNFDMSNRAKLPRGIENIRPHIERVDNVPLLVSLFTDCTPSSAKEMMSVMQDYGEVVCVMGSSANKDNCEIFLQADASISIEPLYPVLCQKFPPYTLPHSGIGPVDLARKLNSVQCSISMARDADISLFSLIAMSRHFVTSLWNATQFWICCLCVITFSQCTCIACGLPNCLSLGAATGSSWCWGIVSATLALASPDTTLMQRAAVKYRTHLSCQTLMFVLWCYGLRIFPTVISIVLQFGFTLHIFCKEIALNNTNVTCHIVYPINVTSDKPERIMWTTTYYDGYYLAQNIALTLLTVHLAVISMSFVHRDYLCWQKCFLSNKLWLASLLFIISVCVAFVSLALSISWTDSWNLSRYKVTWPLYVIYLASPVALFTVNEIVKWQEIRANDRYQRRARLDFGTKLGMNSPFP